MKKDAVHTTYSNGPSCAASSICNNPFSMAIHMDIIDNIILGPDVVYCISPAPLSKDYRKNTLLDFYYLMKIITKHIFNIMVKLPLRRNFYVHFRADDK